jgi:hypothetical protein
MGASSTVVLLSGREKPWPAYGRYRTSPREQRFPGVRFRIDAVYQRTLAELRRRESTLWMVFAPLAVDATAEAMPCVLDDLRVRVTARALGERGVERSVGLCMKEQPKTIVVELASCGPLEHMCGTIDERRVTRSASDSDAGAPVDVAKHAQPGKRTFARRTHTTLSEQRGVPQAVLYVDLRTQRVFKKHPTAKGDPCIEGAWAQAVPERRMGCIERGRVAVTKRARRRSIDGRRTWVPDRERIPTRALEAVACDALASVFVVVVGERGKKCRPTRATHIEKRNLFVLVRSDCDRGSNGASRGLTSARGERQQRAREQTQARHVTISDSRKTSPERIVRATPSTRTTTSRR